MRGFHSALLLTCVVVATTVVVRQERPQRVVEITQYRRCQPGVVPSFDRRVLWEIDGRVVRTEMIEPIEEWMVPK